MNTARRRRRLARVVLIAALVAVAPAATAEEPTTAVAPAAPSAPTAPIVPVYVRPLTGIEAGRNDANPVWTHSGKLIAFERSRGDRKEIVVARADGTIVHTIYYQASQAGKEPKFFFPGLAEDVSYNAGIAWSPAGDRLAFTSNAGTGNYDVYVHELGGKTTRLTDHKEKDGQADWSPVADQLVFVSGRTGKGDLYLVDVASRALTRLTWGTNPFLYPQWSPDGTKVTVLHGSNDNHDVYVIADVRRPAETLRALTTWTHDDLRPVWSPDGKKIAFYSNYNTAGDPKTWAILVIAADGSDPTDGAGLAAKVVATGVVPDIERGPAWLPDSGGIVYVKDDRAEYNPLYVADLVRGTNVLIKTDTKMNHDVTCSVDGVIAFRAQVDQWDQIFVARLKE
jgi:Tol biopolymer transport system component